MRHRSSPKFRVAVAIFCGAILLLLSQGSVLANGGPTSRTPSVTPLVTCSGSGCTGKDPYSTGCASSGYSLKAYPLYVARGQSVSDYYAYIQSASATLGWVQNYYSSTCGTNWAVVTSNSDATITASIDGQNSRIYWWSRGTNTSSWHSPMYYAPSEPTAAYGDISGYSNCLLQADNGVCDHP